ncbi:MAG: XRE family transcriptional regulator [Caulobacterales bacterium 32-69-10]|nr:MAG: XRE family transcriptional regulator [Caulobacterales bacterium 32-69-10]
MDKSADRKLFLGARLRRLRRDLGLTQAAMSREVGVSASYLNLLERNQRPVTAQVLLRLAETFDLDLRNLTADDPASGVSGLSEVFSDPLFQDLGISRHEVAEMVDNAPALAEGVMRLYQAFQDRGRAGALGDDASIGALRVGVPSDWVRDFIQAQKNFFPELEAAAEATYAALTKTDAGLSSALTERLQEVCRARVQIVPSEVLVGMVRRFDHHRRRLLISDLLDSSGRLFALAYHLALLEHGDLINTLADRANPPDRAVRSLLKVSLANYLGAAIIMPYEGFHTAVEQTRYDLDRVCARFGVSFEQACHRLTTLARPGTRGVPFFMLRLDAAGNISKRFAGTDFPFSRFGGACPRWNIHAAFRNAGRVLTQVVETPDGRRYFTIARTVRRAAQTWDEDADLAIGLGCDLKHAGQLIYSRGLDLAAPAVTPIGPVCTLCERPACPQRAAQPVTRTLVVDEFTKAISAYPFAPG